MRVRGSRGFVVSSSSMQAGMVLLAAAAAADGRMRGGCEAECERANLFGMVLMGQW